MLVSPCDWRDRRAKLDRNRDQPWPEPRTATVTPNRGGFSTASRAKQHSGLGFLGRGTERARGHLAADDADQNDRIEVWGTRIGRAHRHHRHRRVPRLARRSTSPPEPDQQLIDLDSPRAVIVISSHVARGSVGNRAAVFALETLGHPGLGGADGDPALASRPWPRHAHRSGPGSVRRADEGSGERAAGWAKSAPCCRAISAMPGRRLPSPRWSRRCRRRTRTRSISATR